MHYTSKSLKKYSQQSVYMYNVHAVVYANSLSYIINISMQYF